jgi:hypothetical protein
MEFRWAGMVNTLLVVVVVRLAAALVNTLLRHGIGLCRNAPNEG